jgi:CheY-like chemotaxis protein
MDGPTATRAIRALGYTGRIFGVTGNGVAADVRLFKASGADRVVLKPFTLADFQDALGVTGTEAGPETKAEETGGAVTEADTGARAVVVEGVAVAI